jgi:hypothetical protein
VEKSGSVWEYVGVSGSMREYVGVKIVHFMHLALFWVRAWVKEAAATGGAWGEAPCPLFRRPQRPRRMPRRLQTELPQCSQPAAGSADGTPTFSHLPQTTDGSDVATCCWSVSLYGVLSQLETPEEKLKQPCMPQRGPHCRAQCSRMASAPRL